MSANEGSMAQDASLQELIKNADWLDRKREERRLSSDRAHVLYQDREWIDVDGRRWPLKQMDPRHRREVQRFVRKRARYYVQQSAWSMVGFAGHVNGEAAQDALDDAMRDLMDLEFGPQEEVDAWLEDSRLMQRLIELDGLCI